MRAAIVAFNTARATFRIAEDALAAARQNSEETTVLYRQGLARSIELSDANSRLFDAEVTVVSSRLSLEQACIELRYALGLEPIEVAGEWPMRLTIAGPAEAALAPPACKGGDEKGGGAPAGAGTGKGGGGGAAPGRAPSIPWRLEVTTQKVNYQVRAPGTS